MSFFYNLFLCFQADNDVNNQRKGGCNSRQPLSQFPSKSCTKQNNKRDKSHRQAA